VLTRETNEVLPRFLVRQGSVWDGKALTTIEPQKDEIIVFRNVAEGSPGIFRHLGLIGTFNTVAIST
jgi:hypothetical protein